MEWSPKTPSQWDWENLMMFNSKAADTHKKLKFTEWRIEEEGDIDVVSLYSSGGDGGSGSDLLHASSSKSSKSPSADSTSLSKVSEFTFEPFGGFPNDLSSEKKLSKSEPSGTSLTLKGSVGSVEPLIGLKLGKRTYFEDFCGSNTKASSLSASPPSCGPTAKRTISSSQGTNASHCQVEGCNLDLTSAKEYHRKHRVCESHSKCPKVIVNGQERRFCQQCSRFHSPSEFDEKKRSCRRRLSDHNARRRKPRPDGIHFNTGRLSSSLFDERQQVNFLMDKFHLVQPGPDEISTWESTCSSNLTNGGYPSRLTKSGVSEGHLHLQGNEPPNSMISFCHDSSRLLSNASTSEVPNQGLEEEAILSTNLNTAQDLRRALSLLSNNSWGPCGPEHSPIDHSAHLNHSSLPVPNPMVQRVPERPPLSSPEQWRNEQSNAGAHFQEFQLFKPESVFYSNQMY